MNEPIDDTDAFAASMNSPLLDLVWVASRLDSIPPFVRPPSPRPDGAANGDVSPELLAAGLIEGLRNTPLVPPSTLLTWERRRALRMKAENAEDVRRLDDQSKLIFLLASARRIREVAAECARQTGKSGLAPDAVAKANEFLRRQDMESRILAECEADDLMREPGSWFRLHVDAGFHPEEVANILGLPHERVGNALRQFETEVNDLLKPLRLP